MKNSKTVLRTTCVGSGKIKRRVRILSERSYLSLVQKLKQRNYATSVKKIIPPKEKTKTFDFPNANVKQIFLYWNLLGFPFTPHRKQSSKTTTRIFTLLKPICKKYETRQIVEALSDAYSLFNNQDFVFKFIYSNTKIALYTFLRLTSEQQRMFSSWATVKKVEKEHGISIPVSWFDEALKGKEYLKKKYMIEGKWAINDKHPEITKEIIPIIQTHLGRELNNRGMEVIIKFSRMLMNFANLNGKDPYYLIDRLSDALNKFRTIKISKVYYLTTDIFWSETFVNELIRWDKYSFWNKTPITDRDKLMK